MDHIIYNSETKSDCIELKAPYYNAINPTTITFEKEKVSASVDSLGHIEFYNEENKSLGFVDVPVSKDPSEYGHSAQYGNVGYSVRDNQIVFHMPVYGWDDSYPHCDGESDRWSRYEVRRFQVVFDCQTQKITIIDK